MSEKNKISVGIVGAAGYTGGELLRILLHHPKVENIYPQSRSQHGKSVADVHTDLFFEDSIHFVAQVPQDVSVLFLCLPHGEAKQYMKDNEGYSDALIIDLSQDFRIKSDDNDFVYGLPELNMEALKSAKHIANPGCFATAIQIALMPLAKAGLLKQDIHISAITGSTGAGVGLTSTSHYTWRSNNISSYKVFNHQHLGEIAQSITQLQDCCPSIHFVPYRGSFTRGILASCYTHSDASQEELEQIFFKYYVHNPFIKCIGRHPDIKQVVGTNNACVYVKKHEDVVFVEAVIDNLLKGASGQAVQNMNIALGYPQHDGLLLKSPAY